MRRAALAAGRHDLVIVNSCGVTNEASRQARQTIRRLKREAPDRDRSSSPAAPPRWSRPASPPCPRSTTIVGNARKTTPTDVAGRVCVLDDRTVSDWKRTRWKRAPRITPARSSPIQNGCDHGCTFCAIPLGPRAPPGRRRSPTSWLRRTRIAMTWVSRDRAHRRRPHLLRRRSCPTGPTLGTAGAGDPARRARARTAAALVDRLRRGRFRSPRRLRRGGAG